MRTATPQTAVSPLQGTERPNEVWTYAEAAQRIENVRALFAEHQIRIHRDSVLSRLFQDATNLARDWDESRTNRNSIQKLISSAHAKRICDAIWSIRNDAACDGYMKRIAANNMDLSGRVQSQGKDALWEVDLLCFLRRNGLSAHLLDPPDIVVDLDFAPYPIACKKIYSERGVEAQMKKGVEQLEKFGNGGLVAFNIDDLVPSRAILASDTASDAAIFLSELNRTFIERSLRKVRRYIESGRCDGLLISTTTLTNIRTSTPRFMTYSDVTLFSPLEVGAASRARIDSLRAKISVIRNGA